MSDAFAKAAKLCGELRAWLLNDAYPIWWEVGADHLRGGFFEKINQDGTPVEAPRRARVQPRQIYAFAAAKTLGWTGPADAAVAHGLDFFLGRYLRPDGLVRTLVGADGEPKDDSVVLYDQAFAIYGLAVAYRLTGEARLRDIAVTLRDALIAERKHPVAGFEEDSPRVTPLLSNPHMHLFEACLEWDEAGGDAQWRVLADEIANLAFSRFVDPKTGGVREYYDGDWNPAPGVDGRILEPGHQFEWGWLLMRWGSLAAHPNAIEAALRMIRIGEGPGVDPQRGVAFFSLLDDMTPHDLSARLWAQTERIKAGVLAAELTGDDSWWDVASAGAQGLLKYFDTPVPGLYRDRMQPDGTFVDEPAPASSLYHIVLAIAEFDRAVKARAG
ncbi:AGE family epimerase/isomerase [Caulobacter segnis]|uniref:AGE family epimerase/isomerase n=1 Tax=Caulobacter segnis TaxID=88688 RepID=UPI00240F011D|nr:AGE family epimerase/isomerase [Caulobacter segnis]MDG2521256.1 AGE family epimerase/isomerase [Caulobacter segnis]